MELSIAISLMVLGLILLLLEMFLVPGISVAGVGGVLSVAASIYYSYQLSSSVGNVSLVVGVIMIAFLAWLFFRSKAIDRMSLNSSIEAKVDLQTGHDINEGDLGITTSRLAPIGKAKINGQFVEVKSEAGFVDENTKIIVLKVLDTNILVKPVL